MPMNILKKPALDDAALKDLQKLLGEKNVSQSEVDRVAYSRDLWPMTHIWMQHGHVPHPPDAIIWVENEDQISSVLKLANQHKFAVIPYAAGSGVCGGALPVRGGVVMDMKKMNRVIDINATTLTLTAEAGLIGQHLEMYLNRMGYTMGHFPSSIYCSSLGGWIAARSAGQLSAKYGKIEDMVLGLRMVLPNGEFAETVITPRSAAGPDWAQLIMGSEGTLAVITKATLKIYPYPKSRLFRGFIFTGVHDALESMRGIMQAGISPAAVRLYDEFDTVLIGDKKEDSVEAPVVLDPPKEKTGKKVKHALFDFVQNFMIGRPNLTGKLAERVKGKCLLVLTFEGEADLTEAELKKAVEICTANNGADQGEDHARRWWENRYNVSYNQSRVFDQGSFVDTIEVATTWDKVEELYDALRKAVVAEHAFIMAHFSHAYVHGCSIYFTTVGRGKNEEDALRVYRTIWDAAMAECLKHGATVTHHHGVGLHKAPYFQKEIAAFSPLYQAIKDYLDPNNILNPGKMGLK